jgi:hypothetical protein
MFWNQSCVPIKLTGLAFLAASTAQAVDAYAACCEIAVHV